MELWIRSQNRNELIPIKDELIQASNCIIYQGNIIGGYKTKERALEVLDEIEEKIMLINTINLVKDADSLIAFRNAVTEEKIKGLGYPYQMPEE